jgi:ABC-type amino acid transport system permease subunit
MEYNRIIGVYDDEKKLFASIDSIQENGYEIADVISPFAIEEVFDKLKLTTKINVAAFLYALFGGVIGVFLFLYYTAVLDYPLNIGGKPSLSLTFIVIIFVGTILVTVLFTLLTFFIRDKKGPGAKEHFQYPGITDDTFLILIDKTPELSDKDIKGINKLLTDGGAIKVDEK